MPSTLTTVISGPHTSGYRSVKETVQTGAPVKQPKPGTKHAVKTPERFDKLRHPWEKRKALSEEYENEKTAREGWWRTYIRETPVPGSYSMEPQGLLYDMNKKQNTYRFKSDGRKVDPDPHGKGAVLLPGAYNHTDFLDRLNKAPATYHFNAPERDKFDMNFGLKDKNINVSPNCYNVEKYLSLTTEEHASTHAMFKSQSRRFPTLQFKPREGPAPGNYESHVMPPRAATFISSSFKSKTPRFSSSHTPDPPLEAKRGIPQNPTSQPNTGRLHLVENLGTFMLGVETRSKAKTAKTGSQIPEILKTGQSMTTPGSSTTRSERGGAKLCGGAQDANGQPPRKRVKKITKDLQTRLRNLCIGFSTGQKTLEEFLRGVGRVVRWKHRA